LPDGGQICEVEIPPIHETSEGHKIYCHIPIEQLKQFEPVIHTITTGDRDTHAS
jgi:peptide/nickel transport system ATP-binding protein